MENKNKNEDPGQKLVFRLRLFLAKLEKILVRELKEEDFFLVWDKAKKNFCFAESPSEEVKIILAGIFIVGSVMWMRGNGFIPIARSDESSLITNAQTNNTKLDDNEEDKKLELKETSASKLEIKSVEEKCQEDKNEKKTSALCGKDDEEEVKKVARERALEIAVSKPRIVRLSCHEKDYGDPSRSDTKGKHTDEDCCPDPDEWPKRGCVYDAHGYSIMLKGSKK